MWLRRIKLIKECIVIESNIGKTEVKEGKENVQISKKIHMIE